MSKNAKPLRPRQITQAVRAGLECDDATGCVVPPIHLTSTFAFRGFGQKRTYDYTRSGNPTRDLLGAAIADLELGVGAVVTATGMAAITLCGYLIPAKGRIVAPHDCYGGTYRLIDKVLTNWGLTYTMVDQTDGAALADALGEAPRAASPSLVTAERPATATTIAITRPNSTGIAIATALPEE